MKSIHQFASEKEPLHCSMLDSLNRCPMKHVLMYIEEYEDLAGEAAATGSAAHAGIAAYHRSLTHEEGLEAGLAAVRASLESFPRADLNNAAQHFTQYVADPRHQTAKIIAVERPVRLVLPPADDDPTGLNIVIEGTIDQIRREDGRLIVVDVKTGGTPGWQMLHDYLFQIAGYAAAATAELGETVEPGYLIRTQGYRRKGVNPAEAPEGIIWPLRLSLTQCQIYLDQVRGLVAQVRAGSVRFGPGMHCSYCPMQGIWTCTARAERHWA